MSVLKSLSFVATPKRTNDPVQMRRNKLVAQLRQQKALLADPNFVSTSQRWTKDETGSRQLVTRQRRVKRWWQEDAAGQCILCVRYGAKTLELEKGKGAVMVGSTDKLSEIIDALVLAVSNGELDAAIAQTQRAGQKAKSKAA